MPFKVSQFISVRKSGIFFPIAYPNHEDSVIFFRGTHRALVFATLGYDVPIFIQHPKLEGKNDLKFDSDNLKNQFIMSLQNAIIKKVPVSSSFGYLIMDSVVAPHDKIDVSRQLSKTVELSFRNVHGDIIDLHGAHVSLSLVFQTLE